MILLKIRKQTYSRSIKPSPIALWNKEGAGDKPNVSNGWMLYCSAALWEVYQIRSSDAQIVQQWSIMMYEEEVVQHVAHPNQALTPQPSGSPI